MSTKINVRSPFFLELTKPAQTLGIFDCDEAGLTGFRITASGSITEPRLKKGTIIGRSANSFPANTGSTAIERTVTYTIEIPENYTNSNDYTITCDATFDQPVDTSTAACPTFSGTIPNYSDTNSQSITLNSYFTAGTDPIAYYRFVTQGDNGITAELTGTVPNQTLVISGNSHECLSADIYVVAGNASYCEIESNTFTFSTPCTEAYDCDEADLEGGSITQDGTVSKATHQVGSVNDIIIKSIGGVADGTTSVLTSLNVGANDTGSDRTVVLTYKMNVPQGYTNSGTIDCDLSYTQPAADAPKTFDCNTANITNMFISDRGNVAAPDVAEGTLVRFSPQFFDKVSVDTVRTVTFTIEPPAGYTNTGVNIDCAKQITQPAEVIECGSVNAYISQQGFDSAEDFCGSTWSATVEVEVELNLDPYPYASIVNTRACRTDSKFAGGNKFYLISNVSSAAAGGDIGAKFEAVKIDDFGVILETRTVNCISRTSFKG